MKDIDIININLRITIKQARHLRRKLHDMSRDKLNQAKRDKTVNYYDESYYFLDYIMWEAIAQDIMEKIDE